MQPNQRTDDLDDNDDNEYDRNMTRTNTTTMNNNIDGNQNELQQKIYVRCLLQ